MHPMKSAAACAALALVAQPCGAAEVVSPVAAGERHSSAFAGLNLRLPLGRAGEKEKPSARLQLSMTHEYRDVTGATLRRHQSRGLELGLGSKGSPAYFVGGQKMSEKDARLRLSGGKTTWLVVAGAVVLAVVVLAAVASAQPTPGPPPGAFD